MALQLVVGEPESGANPSAWMPALEKISAAATREHADSVVRAAAVLGEALRALARSPSSDPSAVSSVLQDGVASLQNALEPPPQDLPSQTTPLPFTPHLISPFPSQPPHPLVHLH